jgi:ubiquinone/menaquinone biosynthesis C-methylase UbiE
MSADPQERAARAAAQQDERARELEEKVRRFVDVRGDERVLDVGTGTGALAFVLAPHVREVVGVDSSTERLTEARRRAADFPNVSFVEADARELPFESGSFDLTATLRTLHHIRRPELVVAELARVTRPGGRILVADQIAPVDPLAALELDRFERAREPTHERLLPETDIRQLAEANELVLRESRVETETRDLDAYLDVAACEGDARDRALALAPARDRYVATLGWYVFAKRSLG